MPGTKAVSKAKLSARKAAIKHTIQQHFGDSEKHPHGAEERFLSANINEIVDKIAKKEPGWNATNVMKAYIRRAIDANELVNCLTEIMFEPALSEAKALDDEFALTGRIRGPLHGVPFSAKDLFDIPGYDSSIGYSRWAHKPATKLAEIIELIRGAGGIFLTKTNVPQTMMSFECNNPVFGTTLHPLKGDKFTSGGSSGGEAALLAMDGAAAGLGSDVGGSLRIPTHFCGIYALKPTGRRTSSFGTAEQVPGFDAVEVSRGPMGRSVSDLERISSVILGQGKARLPITWRPQLVKETRARSLRFGYYLSDGVVKASPACQRAVLQAVDALRAQGHECILFKPPNAAEAMNIFIGLTASEGYKSLTRHLGPDKQDDSLFLVTLGPKLPAFIRAIAQFAIAKGPPKDEIFASFLGNAKHRSLGQYLKVLAAREEFTARWEHEVWETLKFDGVIAPVQALPAVPHGATKALTPMAAATILYNVLDVPVGIVPVTRVDPEKDRLTDEWMGGFGPFKKISEKSTSLTRSASEKHLSLSTSSTSTSIPPPDPQGSGPHGSFILEERAYLGAMGSPRAYDPDLMAGLPVGIQIVGPKIADEQVVGMMHTVDEALNASRYGAERLETFGPGSGRQYL